MTISSQLLRSMQFYVTQPENAATIEQAWAECENDLRTQPGLQMAYRAAVPKLELPDTSTMFSLWVFAFAPNGESDTHKHSNSTQITCTWRGSGRLRIGDPAQAIEVVPPSPSIEQNPEGNWAVIPSSVFHHAKAAATGWSVVSFQTVPAEELQNEPYAGEARYYLS